MFGRIFFIYTVCCYNRREIDMGGMFIPRVEVKVGLHDIIARKMAIYIALTLVKTWGQCKKRREAISLFIRFMQLLRQFTLVVFRSGLVSSLAVIICIIYLVLMCSEVCSSVPYRIIWITVWGPGLTAAP